MIQLLDNDKIALINQDPGEYIYFDKYSLDLGTIYKLPTRLNARAAKAYFETLKIYKYMLYKEIKLVYLDMDGVMVDQYRQLADTVNMTLEEFNEHVQKLAAIGKKEEFIFPVINQSVEIDGFINAPAYEDIDEFRRLITWCENNNIAVEILSSCMQEESTYEEVKRQKIEWLNNHGFGNLKANFPKGSYLKQFYAKPNTLLIDDYLRNIDQWKLKGGVGIHHTSISDTMKQLANIGIT